MKKISRKTSEITQVYNILKSAMLSKMETAGKFSVIRTVCALKPVAEAFNDFRKDAHERLRPGDFDEIRRKAEAFDTLSDEEKIAVNKAVMDYEQAVNECVAEEAAREQEVEVHPLTEEAFGRFMESNPDLQSEAFAAVMDFMEE